LQNLADAQVALRQWQRLYDACGISVSPQVVAIGDSLDSIDTFYVFVDSFTYVLDSPLKALDVAFKSFQALDAEYHKECQREWHFIEQAIYDLSASQDLDRPTRALIQKFRLFCDAN